MDRISNKYKKILISLCLALTVFFSYNEVRRNDFINFDDVSYIIDNSYVQGGLSKEGFVWAWKTDHASNWHPLTWLSLMVDYEFFRLNPAGYHWTNVLFHAASAVVLFLVLGRMTGSLWRSGFVAVLFAVHPLHVESVAWVAERKDVLSALFWMLTIWAYVWYVERPGLPRYLVVLFTFMVGLTAKPMLVTLPFVLLLLDYWPLGRLRAGGVAGVIAEKIPLIVCSAVSSVVTFLVQQGREAVASLEFLSLGMRLANAFVSYAWYVLKMFWPVNLAIFYPHPGVWPVWTVAGSALLVIGVTVLVIAGARRYPYCVVGWLWYCGTLVPVIGIVQVGSQAMADRYTYIPLIGLFVMVVWFAAEYLMRLRYGRMIGVAVSGLVLSALAVLTCFQVQYWRDSETVFRHALRVTTGNYLAHNNLGTALFIEGRLQEAMGHYMEAARIKLNYADAYNNMGIVMSFLRKYEEAVSYYSRALQIKPNDERVHNNLANSYYDTGRLDESILHYREALKIKPDYADVHNNMGLALAQKGRFDESIIHFREALRIKPDHIEARKNMDAIMEYHAWQ